VSLSHGPQPQGYRRTDLTEFVPAPVKAIVMRLPAVANSIGFIACVAIKTRTVHWKDMRIGSPVSAAAFLLELVVV